MFKKTVVVLGIVLLPGIVFAQMHNMEELTFRHNEFSVSAAFINMKPINDYIADAQHGGFPPFTTMPILYGYAQKNQTGKDMFWGVRFMTTLSGFAWLEPNFFNRNLTSLTGKNRAEMSITMVEFVIEYKLLELGGFTVNAGSGFGIGGTTLTLLRTTNSGKFWMVSFLLRPQARAAYHFLKDSEGSVILALNAAYNYLPVTGWNSDAGSLDAPPGPGHPTPFDLSGASVDLSISFPFATK